MSKKIIALFMAAVSILTLASCGGKTGTEETTSTGTSASKSGDGIDVSSIDLDYSASVLAGAHYDTGDVFADVKQTIDPEKIYDSIEYTGSMFYGEYSCDYDEFKETADMSRTEIKYVKESIIEEPAEKEYTVSTLPWKWVSGRNPQIITSYGASPYDLMEQEDGNWAVLYFASEESDNIYGVFRYDIDGNKINLYEATNLEKGDDGVITYDLSETQLVYTFAFRGPYMILSDGKNSVVLNSSCFSEETCTVKAYSLPDSKLIGGVDSFSSSAFKGFDGTMITCAERRNGSDMTFDLKLCGNGVAYLRITEEDSEGNETVTDKQFVYFVSDRSYVNLHNSVSLVLADENGVYDYSDDYVEREKRINDGQEFTNEELEKVDDLYDDLEAEFEAEGIDVTIDKVNGEISIDATVVFEGDKSELTDEGKAFLDKFTKVYFSIISQDKYKDFIVGTKIEGHTAPLENSTYDSGLPLSTERAENVKSYIESSADVVGTLEAIGMSNSKPVYDENGQVDLDACRRVSFSFIIATSGEDA